MPISYQAYVNPELQKQEEERHFWRSALIPFGTAAAGASLGALLVNPVGRWRHSRLAEKARQHINDSNAGRMMLDELHDYHRGSKSLQDFGTSSQQQAVLQQYENFKPLFEADEIIQDRIRNSASSADRRHFEYLDRLSKGELTFEDIPPIYHDRLNELYQQNKQLFDNRSRLKKLQDIPLRDANSIPGYEKVSLQTVFSNPVTAFQYPSVSVGGLIGYGVGQAGTHLAHQAKMNELYEQAKAEQNASLSKESMLIENHITKQGHFNNKKKRSSLFTYSKNVIQ